MYLVQLACCYSEMQIDLFPFVRNILKSKKKKKDEKLERIGVKKEGMISFIIASHVIRQYQNKGVSEFFTHSQRHYNSQVAKQTIFELPDL